jgi:hypothetical protein
MGFSPWGTSAAEAAHNTQPLQHLKCCSTQIQSAGGMELSTRGLSRTSPRVAAHCADPPRATCFASSASRLAETGYFSNAQDAFLFTSLYSSGAPAPFYRPRARHSRPAPSKAATPHFAAYRYPHVERRRCVERGRTSLSARLQYLSDVFFQSEAMGC